MTRTEKSMISRLKNALADQKRKAAKKKIREPRPRIVPKPKLFAAELLKKSIRSHVRRQKRMLADVRRGRFNTRFGSAILV